MSHTLPMRCDSSSIERRYAEMLTAREEWMHAYKELKQALVVFQSLNVTRECADEHPALKNARMEELRALERYIAAVNLHHEAVLIGGGLISTT